MLNVTNESFEADVLESDIPVLVDFWAEWCGPCKMVLPILESLESQYEGKIKLVKANSDDCADLMAKYNVRSVPTMIVFKSGEPVDQLIGAQMRSAITAILDKHA